MRMRVVFLLVVALGSWVCGEQHILLDTTKESMLDWTRYPYGPQSPTPGWVEESFTNFEKGINWRSYVVCDVGYSNVNNWLWTPFITRHDANRIYIEVKFSLRNCDLFPGTALQCKETFSLLYYEFDAATREPPPWEPESYKQIDVIAADEGRFTNNNEVIINTETRSIEVTKKGVYFAFRDQGACISLLAVKVYYLKCPEIAVSFATYPETATGSKLSDIQKISGTCVAHSEPAQKKPPHNLCTADGSWGFHSGVCSCVAGYQADSQNKTCLPCAVGHFKSQAGENHATITATTNTGTACQICPAHSQALYSGSVECQCNEGYYRAPSDSKEKACTRPPSAPENVAFFFKDTSSVVLTWEPPKDEGARSDTKYQVTCPNCPASRLKYVPNGETLSGTTVTVSGLYDGLTYTFRITAVNGVSAAAAAQHQKDGSSSSSSSSDISVSSKPAFPSVVSNVQIEDDVKPGQLKVTWSTPDYRPLEIEAYEVKYFLRRSPNISNIVITKRNSAVIKNLEVGSDYGFQVRGQSSSSGWGEFSPPVFFQSKASSSREGGGGGDAPVFVGAEEELSEEANVAVGVSIGLIIVMVLIICLVFVVKRRLRWSGSDKDHCKEVLNYDIHGGGNNSLGGLASSDCHHHHPLHHPIVHTHTPHLGQQQALYNPFSLHKTYIDPHTYEDPNIAVKQFAKEIDAKYITIEAIIGGGEFGDVCRGRLSIPDRNDMLVAIKTLKHGSSDKERIDFLTEASIMGQFEHPNVIFLQGVVTKANPIMILTEYMENGSLDTFLRANDGKFQVRNID